MRNSPTDFRACTVKFNGLANRIITDIKIFPAFDPEQPPFPPIPAYESKALWDTGATKSLITGSTARAMSLYSVGTTIMKHAGGSSPVNNYLVNFFLPNNVGISGVLVSECQDDTGSFGAIIGMDIITKGDFSITNVGGETCMTFRFPSINTIDYVAEARRLKYAGVGRNAPCPCGKKDASGKAVKFKKCCGK